MKAIFLDIDGTLYRSSDYEQHLLTSAVTVIAECLGVDKAEAFKKLYQTKKIHKTVSKSVEVLGIDRRKFYSLLAEKVQPCRFLAPDASLKRFFAEVRDRKLFVGLHTNSGKKLALKVLGCLGVDDGCYDALVTSDDAEPKPSLEGFRLLLSMADASPEEALYVGDRCEVELEPAKRLGMRTAEIHTRGCPYADIHLNSLQELLNLI
ncbi:HAD-superfamily hydrolase [Candidatus Caldarchaeum subterraneum]|uniref:HAD-superfamily hydrolase n=1 Tax=Caldiarchaeum subterraneum TaxID=311458 RepID=E6N8D3_CALS0|nr:HAD-superfamily hydrolase [Candidatus Caldarchaeum subterraneum]BAJ48602.1 HAD-superfamily hydrolase [Candidatus Caldarchaeum subterraneum]BAJ51310.1 HAD-superfamily hydrolase [Candidatus Caldarchaeum subterraneum]